MSENLLKISIFEGGELVSAKFLYRMGRPNNHFCMDR